MLQRSIKAPVTRVITPLCRGLLKAGITPNAMSALGIADTGIIINLGKLVTTGKSKDLTSDPALQAAYLGY